MLINLLDPSDQEKALNNLVELVNVKGLLIFIESFKSGLENLNSARSEFHLDKLPPAHHNLYLNDHFFEYPSLEAFPSVSHNTFSGHYFVSRVLHPAFLQSSDNEFVRNSHFVSFFSQALPSAVGNYSPLKFLTFKKN